MNWNGLRSYPVSYPASYPLRRSAAIVFNNIDQHTSTDTEMMPSQGDADLKLRQIQLQSLTVPTNNKLQNAPLNPVLFISSFICAAFSSTLAPGFQNQTTLYLWHEVRGPHFLVIFKTSNSLSVHSRSLKKIYRIEHFRQWTSLSSRQWRQTAWL